MLGHWYGIRYGDEEGHDHPGAGSIGCDSEARCGWKGRKCVRFRPTRSVDGARRRSGLGRNAGPGARCNRGAAHAQRTSLGGRPTAIPAPTKAKAECRMSGVTLDAGGLIALDRNDRRIIALLARANESGARITIPATALAQAMRSPLKQARLSRLVRQPTTRLMALDGPDATQVGVLLAASRTTDIADAHVVICARRHAEPIVTSDPGDLRRLDAKARLIVV